MLKEPVIQMVLLSTHNICFGWERRKLFFCDTLLTKSLGNSQLHIFILLFLREGGEGCVMGVALSSKPISILLMKVQSNFGRSNSPVSNTRDRSNSFVGPGNFPIHLMLKYTPSSNRDNSNSGTQSTVRRGIFYVKTLWWLEPNISLHESVTRLI